MQIPEYFCSKIVRAFGEPGQRWLDELPQVLNKCMENWQLTDCTVAEGLSINLVCFAKSAEYGEVVLKIGSPNAEIFTEMTALSLYAGRHICRCYAVDKDLRALLLERIIPGQNLTAVADLRAQLDIAANLISHIPIPLTEDHGLPTYTHWVQKAFTRAREEGKVGREMLSLIDAAEELFAELEMESRPQMLLHGDLHHWNILMDEKGVWKAIDPHGVVGMACMEAARFMNNHIDMVVDAEKLPHLDEMVSVFSAVFHEPKRVLAICLYVLFVLSTCWTYEEDDPAEEGLIRMTENCQRILGYVRAFV